MNIDKLYNILRETTVQLRKGEEIEGDPNLVDAIKNGEDLDKAGGGVVHIYDMPPVEAAREDLEKVDMHFVIVGVDKAAAEAHKVELVEILNDYPDPDRLAGGPCYIELGGVVGDQGAALQLMALGKVMGLWEVMIPENLGFTGAEADAMAGAGLVLITGYKQPQSV